MRVLMVFLSALVLLCGTYDAEARSKRGKSAKAKRPAVHRVAPRPKPAPRPRVAARPAVVVAPVVRVTPGAAPAPRQPATVRRAPVAQGACRIVPPPAGFAFPPGAQAYCCNGKFDMTGPNTLSCNGMGGVRHYRP